MGHYDSCRDADDDRRQERSGQHLKNRCAKLTDMEAGELHAQLEALVDLLTKISANMSQLQKLEQIRKSLRSIM